MSYLEGGIRGVDHGIGKPEAGAAGIPKSDHRVQVYV